MVFMSFTILNALSTSLACDPNCCRSDLPSMIARLAVAAGMGFDHRLIKVGGASLRTHWNKGKAQDAIKTGRYARGCTRTFGCSVL